MSFPTKTSKLEVDPLVEKKTTDEQAKAYVDLRERESNELLSTARPAEGEGGEGRYRSHHTESAPKLVHQRPCNDQKDIDSNIQKIKAKGHVTRK